MLKIWGKTIKKNKIIRSHMIQLDTNFTEDTVFCGVDTICEHFDIPRPIVLNKHKRDLNEFFLMRFLSEDFIEKVHFDKFEIEVYLEKKKN
ncbi:MAG: hypothetical protein KAQ68_06555 [Clostridiales bacterium]|nr:hypothetical protein [Clostridiales bacterium]